MSIEATWNTVQQIRELFRPIEQRQWGAREYALELMIQTGHLGDILLRQEYKINQRSPEENINVLGDEVVDVILNTFSVAQGLGVDIPTVLRNQNNNGTLWEELIENSLILYPGPVDPLNIYADIVRSSSQVLSGLTNDAGTAIQVTSDLTRITYGTARIAGLYGINIDTAFATMHNESIEFMNSYKK